MTITTGQRLHERVDALTLVPSKRERFLDESYLRESWHSAREVLGEDLVPAVHGYAMLVLKPEAVIGRRGPRCLEFLESAGFRPVFAKRLRYTRHALREIWRYQWNIATLDRLALGDLLYGACDSLLVVLRDDEPDGRLPASVRLAGLKGSSLPWDRHDGHLRSVLGALNRMVVMVHCSDEPIDILREVGILFDADGRREVWCALHRDLRTGRTLHVRRELRAAEAAAPRFEISVGSAAQHLLGALSVHPDGRGEHAIELIRRFRDRPPHTADGLSWAEWIVAMRTGGIDESWWPSLLFASHHIRHDIPGATCVIAESGRERWLAS
jgi:hypothetical protein